MKSILLVVLIGFIMPALHAQGEVGFTYRGEIELPEGTVALSAEIWDIDHDGCCDMVIGTQAGNILVYEAAAPGSFDFELLYEDLPLDFSMTGWRVYVSVCDYTFGGLTNLIVRYYRNSNPLHPAFLAEQSQVNPYEFVVLSDDFTDQYGDVAFYGGTCYDVDGDEMMDFLSATLDGLVRYERTEAGLTAFHRYSGYYDGISWDTGWGSAPGFGNIDQDATPDLIVGSEWETVIWAEYDPSDGLYHGVAYIDELESHLVGQNQFSLYDIDDDGDDDLTLYVSQYPTPYPHLRKHIRHLGGGIAGAGCQEPEHLPASGGIDGQCPVLAVTTIAV